MAIASLNIPMPSLANWKHYPHSIILEETEPERLLYLAIRKSTYQEIFSEAIGNLVIKNNSLRLLVFEPKKEEITKWIT